MDNIEPKSQLLVASATQFSTVPSRMPTQHFILATAGHVDHGKSSLVKALTGTDPDRLPEEKARGITIDLGFAHLELPAERPPAPGTIFENASPHPPGVPIPSEPPHSTYSLGIVDVPGHEDFVKNMVAGVGSIDVALLVVASDDGWMPQTEEHLQILNYLGVSQAVVALTKIDLAPQPLPEVMASIRSRLAGSAFARAEIIPTSTVNGAGLDQLKLTLARVLATTPAPRDIGKPRLPVDRVFTLRGIGTVVTGTLSGGSLRQGQSVVAQPRGGSARIRTIQTHGREITTCGPGVRTALNLPDLTGGAEATVTSLQRGDVITLADFGSASETLDVWIEKSPRLREKATPESRPLKDGVRVRIHLGSGSVSARLALIGTPALGPGEGALAQLRCEAPVFVFVGDRFIVRDCAEQRTLAGGVILDAGAQRRGLRNPARVAFLKQRAAAPKDVGIFVRSELIRYGACKAATLLLQSRFSGEEIRQAIDELIRNAEALHHGEWILEKSWWQELQKRTANAVEGDHRSHPQNQGLAISALRELVSADLPANELFDVLLSDLYRTGFVQAGSVVRKTSHRPALPPHLQAAGTRLRVALTAKPLEPPSRAELASDSLSQQALRFLLQTGEATELGPEVIVLTEAFDRMTGAVRECLRTRGRASVSELRQAIGTSRRIVVPLLERLDKVGVTRREGDTRILRTPASAK